MKSKLFLLLFFVQLVTACNNENGTINGINAQNNKFIEIEKFLFQENMEIDIDTDKSNYDNAVVIDYATYPGFDQFYILTKISLFEEIYPNIKIVRNEDYINCYSVDAFINKAKTAIMAGEYPDLLLNVKGNYSSFSSQRENGIFTDFYKLMEKDEDFLLEDYYTNVFDAFTIGQSMYSFPVSFTYYTMLINNKVPNKIK